MEEAAKAKRKRKKESGQTLFEYILLVLFMLFFARFIYFHDEYGFQGSLQRTMLRLGAYLEQNLKSGTGAGENTGAMDPYAGGGNWSN